METETQRLNRRIEKYQHAMRMSEEKERQDAARRQARADLSATAKLAIYHAWQFTKATMSAAKKPIPPPEGPIGDVIRSYCAEIGVHPSLVMGRNRSARAARIRAKAMWLARVQTGASYPALGAAFGRHHTTVIHAVRLIEAEGHPP